MSKKLKVGDVVEFRKIEGPVMVINDRIDCDGDVQVIYEDYKGTICRTGVNHKLLRRVKK